ncbi:hypothetical protein K2X92_00875 [Candidatus Gracilibacteria bacterium]|nr:hypothetical protein [Candidatus Gracilibacteria bacterium]
MSDYITNSKNRKLKTKILLFLSRINIGAGKLPISGRVIILMEFILASSLFFPWVHLELDETIENYYAFSQFSLYVGYAIVFAICTIPFFLLSHTKKERLRSLVPFRLSDTQAIVFIISIILTILGSLITLNNLFGTRIALGSSLGTGFKIAFSTIICILISAYFLSRATKISNTDICYLDHQVDDELLKYKGILKGEDEKNTKNMSLPI